MKKIIICAMLLVFTTTLFSQQTNPEQSFTPRDYMKKSKKQKSAAWVLLGGGTALIGAGLLIGDRKESSFDNAATGGIIGIIGAVSAIASIPLFLASERNKRKATNVSTYFKIRQNPVVSKAVWAYRSFPALSVKVNF